MLGTFSRRIPSNANGTGDIHIPEWQYPYEPAQNYTGSSPFCGWPNFIYQSDEERGFHTVCDGRVNGNDSAPEAGPAVWVSEDFLFLPLPEGKWFLRLDMLMPKHENGTGGERIFCVEGEAYLNY
jgi:hypothetical protein